MHPYWLVVIAIILTFASKIPLAFAMAREGKGYDNRHPRQQMARLTGWGQRAWAAHQNSIEALPIFMVGIVIGIHLGLDRSVLFTWGSIFLVARILYIILYLQNFDRIRSLVWFVGLIASLAPLVQGLCL